MRADIREALDEACSTNLSSKGPVRLAGRTPARVFLHRLRLFLEELPRDLTLDELRDEIGEADRFEATT